MEGSPKRRLWCSLAATAAGVLTASCTGSSNNDLAAQHNGNSGGMTSAMAGTGGAGAAGTTTTGGQAGAQIVLFGSAGGLGGSDGGTCDRRCPDRSTLRQQCMQISRLPDSRVDAATDAGFDATADSAVDASWDGGVSCTIAIDQSYCYVDSVLLDCAPLDPESYTSDRQGHVTLEGRACEAVNATGPHRIDVVLGCPLDR